MLGAGLCTADPPVHRADPAHLRVLKEIYYSGKNWKAIPETVRMLHNQKKQRVHLQDGILVRVL